MVKVLFDAYWWGEGPLAVRHIMREIILTWHAGHPEDELTVLTRSRDVVNARRQLGPYVDVRSTGIRPQALLAAIGTARVKRQVNADIVFTHNFASLGPSSVVFLHDLMFKSNPEWFTRAERSYFSLMAPLAKQAQLVLTTSRTEAHRIERYVPHTPVQNVGVGVSEELLSADSVPPNDTLPSRGFVLAVGRLNTRKNLKRVLDSLLETEIVRPDFPLVVVGEPDGAQEENSLVSTRGVKSGALRFAGRVSDGELKWLYEEARVSTYVSLDEGYGLPPLESLALGTPVVVSDIPIFRETVGGHATFVNPHDKDAIARGVAAELATPLTPERTEALRQHGRSVRWDSVVAAIRQCSVDACMTHDGAR